MSDHVPARVPAAPAALRLRGRTFDASRVYARSVAVIYGLLAIMGLIPGLNTVFGLVPIHGHDVWLHLLIAAPAAYFGWAAAPVTSPGTTHVADVSS